MSPQHTYAPPQYPTSENSLVPCAYSIVLNPEKIRVAFYIFFWTMCGFATVLTKFFVVPMLAAGNPKEPIERLGCGPFNREGSNRTGFEDLTYGQGFAMNQSHLEEAFGFGNICTNWDYSPARELTAMYFPLFEYSFAIYLVLDYVVMTFSARKGEIPQWFMHVVSVVTPLCIVLVAFFRMIFVCIAYENVQQHTAGFLGMQIALLLVAVMNVCYIIVTKQGYPSFGISPQLATKIAFVYLVINGLVSLVKIYGTVVIVFGKRTPRYFFWKTFLGLDLGQVIDLIWMLMNAILPLIIAYVRSVDEENVTVTVSAPHHIYYRSETTGETAQLLQQS